ncbi:MAG: glucosaminidase domain-containing protein, partial [Saprospiraceae bacterium]|nr:glucosaminidase domain-containing protein [Saprospiraceae bacterium]
MHPNRLLFFTILFLNQSASAQSPAELRMDSLRADYIRRYQDIAMDEMEHSGVPASIKLAQAILESRAGTSELAQQASNHFGIKCGKGWTGPSYAKFDDERDRQGRPRNSCFRKYASVVECYADHSTFIRNPEKAYRYGFLFELDPRDYKAWAEGLEKAGYSTVDYYAERLIYFIEHYRLYELDERAVNGRVALKRLAEINGVKMLQARQGETLLDMARLANLPSERLQAFNDGQYAPDQPLRQGDWVFIQPKAEQWSGAETFHQIEPGQGLFQVAQRYGIRLESLLALDGVIAGDQPAPYEFLRLRG